jgi:hypothetical protein
MITTYILGGLVIAGLSFWQNLINTRRRSSMFIVNDGLERWLVDFTIMRMYYRHFYKVPHPTDRDLSLNYEIRSRMAWTGSGVHTLIPQLWEMKLTKESHDLTHRSAVDRLANPSGLSVKSRNRVRKEIQLDLIELGPEPTWKPVPHWLKVILNSRHEVFLRYQLPHEEGLYENHPGRVEDLERYLTRDGSLTCSNGLKGGSQSKRYLKIYGIASSTAGSQTAPKRRDSRALTG